MPELDPGVLNRVRQHVITHGSLPGPRELAALARDAGSVLSRPDVLELAHRMRAELVGAGPLQPLLEDPGVSDVLVNGPGQVWVDRGVGLERVAVDVGDVTAVRALAVRLAAAGGQRLDDAEPLADARLPDGTRLHAVLPPIATEPLISLRTLRPRSFRLSELVALGSMAAPVAALLRVLVRRRANLLISGATGTGKTTLLATLLSLVAPDQRIVCIEECGELAPDHPHVVKLAPRRANVEAAGEIDLVTLARHALRMRPDRIVLGECRGPEVREVLTALNTGHEGGFATLHANSVADVVARLEALGSLAGMTPAAVAAQAASALHAVVHLRRDPRRVTQVGLVRRDPFRVEVAVHIAPDGRPVRGVAWDELARRWEVGDLL